MYVSPKRPQRLVIMSMQAILPIILAIALTGGGFVVAAQETGSTPEQIVPAPPSEPAPPPAEEPAPPPAEEPAPPPAEEPAPPAEEPAPPAEEPAPPGEPVVPAEPVVPDPSEPAPPTEPEPASSEVPDATATETDAPTQPTTSETETPTEIPAQASTPTAEPTPTPEPTPVITWSQVDQVSCVLGDGVTAGLGYQQSNRYYCNASVNVSSDIEMPTDMNIEWTLDLAFPDTYQLQFPAGSAAAVLQSVATSATSTQYTITQPWQQGSGQQNLAFEVVITRNTCAVGEQILTVQASPSISTNASQAEINQTGSQPAANQSAASFLPNLDKLSVSMTPVDFGSLQWDGSSWGSTTGSSTVTITNSNPCPTDQAHIVNLAINTTEPGMMPVITAIDLPGELLAGGNGAVATVPAGFSSEVTVVVHFDLSPTNNVPVGNYTIGFDVSVSPAP